MGNNRGATHSQAASVIYLARQSKNFIDFGRGYLSNEDVNITMVLAIVIAGIITILAHFDIV